jgi:lysyl-tRNA synthetase class 2
MPARQTVFPRHKLPCLHDLVSKSILRSRVNRGLRSFFDERGYLEVDTPLLSPDLIPESSIEIFKTNRLDINGGMEEFYLIPSPEIWMKKLLAGGSGSIYQICKSFRNSEQSGQTA